MKRILKQFAIITNKSIETSSKYKDIDHLKLLDSYLAISPSIPQTSSLVSFSIIDFSDPDIQKVQDLLTTQSFSSIKESKAFAMFIGSSVGDALGAHLECLYYNPKGYGIEDFTDIDIEKPRFPIGQWTDDTAEALCLSDSLLINDLKFDPIDIRARFVNWWYAGYNNGKKNETGDEKKKVSCGIGGYTLTGLNQFIHERTPFVEKKEIPNRQIQMAP